MFKGSTNPWKSWYPSTYSQDPPAVLAPQETVQLVTKRAALNVQRETARRAVLHKKENVSRPLINTKRLRGKILSVLWQETNKRTNLMCRCKFDSSNNKQMCDLFKDGGNCQLVFFSEGKSSFSRSARNLVTETHQKYGSGISNYATHVQN